MAWAGVEYVVLLLTTELTTCTLLLTPYTLLGVEYVVFDEADRLFEMGFATQVRLRGSLVRLRGSLVRVRLRGSLVRVA